MIIALIVLIILLYVYAGLVLARDLRGHWLELLSEPGPLPLQALSSMVLYFISAFGISDFAICTALYHKTGWAVPRKLPGTLNTQCSFPVMIYAVSYLAGIKVDIATLLPCIISFTLGAYLSPRFAVRLPERRIRQVLVAGLLFAGTFILANKLQLIHLDGQNMGLSGAKLFIAPILFFIFGILKVMGIGCYPLIMATAYFLGLHPLVSYPMMMGSGALAAPMVLVRYIRLDSYMRKLTMLAATFGVVGATLAVFVVKSLDISLLQWLVLVVVYYAAFDMSLRLRREAKNISAKL